MSPIVMMPGRVQDYSETIISEGPEGYWKLDDLGSPPSQATDFSGNGNHLTTVVSTRLNAGQSPLLTGSTYSTEWAATLAVDGTGFRAPSNYFSGLSLPFTVEFWITRTGAAGNHYVIATHRRGTANYSGGKVWFSSGGTLFVEYGNGSGASSASRRTFNGSPGGGTPIGGPYHIVVVWAAVPSTIKAYVNASPLTMVYNSGSANSVSFSQGSFSLGVDWDNTNDSMQGFVDDVALYDFELSAAQVSNHYALGTA